MARVSVSELCCPVCWELLTILTEETPLALRGCHSMIYPVELPKWLPSEVVDEMNERFQNHLRQEIEIMLQGAEQGDEIAQAAPVTPLTKVSQNIY
jgi:hypothetical protein